MRTKYTFYNFLVSVISGVLVPILGFVKVRLFIALYGSDLNGLYLVFSQVAVYLNICELSFSLAFRQLLFKPIADGNKEEINRIYSGVKKVYQFVGSVVLGLSVIVAFLIPLFTENVVPVSEMVTLFLIMCLPFGISYFVLPPSMIIIADQKEYKISTWIQTIAILRMFLMIAVILVKLPYTWIFVIEGLNVLISNVVANRIAHKTYPWLKTIKKEKVNKEFVESAKGTLVQRLSNIAITNSDSIIINVMMDLTSVSIYGAYNYLIEAALKIINSVITSPINSFGNLFNSDSESAYGVFEEFYELSMYFATILSVCIFAVLDEFVLIWVHEPSYTLPLIVSVIFSINVFYLTQREAVILIRDANRLFIEAKKNAYIMTAVKIVLSFVLVSKFGILGVLLATLIAYGIVDFTYNPMLIYKKVFKRDSKEYYLKFALRMAISAGLALVTYMLFQNTVIYIGDSLFHFVIILAILGCSVLVVTTAIYYVLFPSYRRLVSRFTKLLFKR